MGNCVGDSVGVAVGATDLKLGFWVGSPVGVLVVGARVGEKEGFLYPSTVGDRVFVGAYDLQDKYWDFHV